MRGVRCGQGNRTQRGRGVKVESIISLSPEQIAEAFADLDDESQAKFFNHLSLYVAKEYHMGHFGFSMQMEGMKLRSKPDGPELDTGGLEIMRIIGGNY